MVEPAGQTPWGRSGRAKTARGPRRRTGDSCTSKPFPLREERPPAGAVARRLIRDQAAPEKSGGKQRIYRRRAAGGSAGEKRPVDRTARRVEAEVAPAAFPVEVGFQAVRRTGFRCGACSGHAGEKNRPRSRKRTVRKPRNGSLKPGFRRKTSHVEKGYQIMASRLARPHDVPRRRLAHLPVHMKNKWRRATPP